VSGGGISTSPQTDVHASIPPLNFTGQMPDALPAAQQQRKEAKKSRDKIGQF